MTLRSVIEGTGSALPRRRVDNDELSTMVDTSEPHTSAYRQSAKCSIVEDGKDRRVSTYPETED